MKTAIIYYSNHHGNTKKLVEAVAQGRDVALIDAAAAGSADLSGYELIGFASGIYFGKFHESVLDFAKNNLPEGKKVFFLSTYGGSSNTRAIEEIVKTKTPVSWGSSAVRAMTPSAPSSWWAASPKDIRTKPT